VNIIAIHYKSEACPREKLDGGTMHSGRNRRLTFYMTDDALCISSLRYGVGALTTYFLHIFFDIQDVLRYQAKTLTCTTIIFQIKLYYAASNIVLINKF